MFVRRSEPIPIVEEDLEGLCPSLNRPVVDAPEMPVGPARAAIALFQRAGGARALAVAIRSEDSGAVTLFEFQGELSAAAHQALDTGLTFAEGMGFLFDDDMLAEAGGGRRRALECWCELVGEDLPPVAEQREPEPPLRPTPLEDGAMMLDDLVESIEGDLGDELDLEVDLGPDLDAIPAPPEPAPQAPQLSKFRVRRGAPPDATEGPAPAPSGDEISGAQLGRIPILRRRRSADEAGPTLLTRLLARF
jgi:hypothetical protein